MIAEPADAATLARAERLSDAAVGVLVQAFIRRLMATEEGRQLVDLVIAEVIRADEEQRNRAN